MKIQHIIIGVVAAFALYIFMTANLSKASDEQTSVVADTTLANQIELLMKRDTMLIRNLNNMGNFVRGNMRVLNSIDTAAFSEVYKTKITEDGKTVFEIQSSANTE